MIKCLLILINTCFSVILSQKDIESFNHNVVVNSRIYFISQRDLLNCVNYQFYEVDSILKKFLEKRCTELFFVYIKQIKESIPSEPMPLFALNVYSYEFCENEETTEYMLCSFDISSM